MSVKSKRILFINTFLKIGGIQSSMINIVNELCKEYQVDLFLYNPEGPLKERLDSRVKVLKPSMFLRALGMSFEAALRSKNPLIILFKLFASVWSRIFDNRLPIWIATKLQPKLKGYDLAIAFRPETRRNMSTSGFARVLSRCVEAKTKAVWIHYDILMLNNDNDFNKKYYKAVDKIIGVSKSVMEAFKSVNPDLSEKMDYCYNILEYDSILKKSKAKQAVKYPEDKFICFSASRFSVGKAIVRAINAIAPVFMEHKDIMWYIAGDGPERENIEATIEEQDLKERIVLLGNQSNPYHYMKNADLYLSTSLHEAAPMVYMEAKALHVPVFTTRTLSSEEMLKDGVEDFICENSEEGIREKFAEIMDNRCIVYEAKANMKDYCGNNDTSLDKVAEWLR